MRPGSTSDSNRDFTEVVRTLTFAPGETEKTCDIPIIDDNLDEPFERATATFRKTAGPAGVLFGNIVRLTPVFTVEDDDDAPTVGFASVANAITQSGSAEDHTIEESVGSATSPNNRYEFEVKLSSASGRVGSCEYYEDATTARLCNLAGPNSTRRNTVEVFVEFEAITDTAKVANPATEGTDYRIVEPAGGVKRLYFREGQTTAKIVVEIIDDSDNELDENIAFELKNPRNLTLGTKDSFILRIADNDFPQITVSPSEVDENVGTANFTIRQSGVSSFSTVAIIPHCGNYRTATSACAPTTAKPDSDFVAPPATLVIPGIGSGTTHSFDNNDSIQYMINITDDSTDEYAENFIFNILRQTLSGIDGQESELEVTIRADSTDAPPTVSLDIDSSVSENLSNGMAEFTAFLSEPSGKEVTVDYATENGTAIAGQDYASTQGTLTFAPGEDEKVFEIAITNDTTDEDAETFAIVLLDDANLSNATLGARTRQTVTILEDATDPPPAPTLPAPAESKGEGETYAFNVALGGDNERERTYDVSFGATGDTAVAGTDYVATPNLQVTVPKGETAATFEVEILVDGDERELDETFTVTLQAVGDPSQTATVVATIASMDEVLTMRLLGLKSNGADIAIENPERLSIPEGGGAGKEGEVEALFSLVLDPSGTPSGRSATFDLSVNDVSATLGEDYQDTDGLNGTSRTFVEGTPHLIVFNILDDDDSGSSEVFAITAKGTSGTTATLLFQVTIVDNDGPDPILREIGRHVVARTEALVENQPRLIPMLRDSGAGDGTEFSVRLTEEGVQDADGGFMSETLWGATTLSRSTDGDGEHEHLLATLGAHARMSERLHLGGMLQFDRTVTKPGGEVVSGEIHGAGWMAGPYFAMRDASNPLFFEGRLLYGRATNEVDALVIGSGNVPRTAAFLDSERWLAQARVEGVYRFDRGTRLIPLADLSHARDIMGPFLDSEGDSVEGQTISLSKLQIGAELEIPLDTARGDLRFRPGLRFVVSDSTGGAFAGEEDGEAGLRSRGRIDFGIDYRLDGNIVLGFESFYSGFGRKELESYGAGLDLRVDF